MTHPTDTLRLEPCPFCGSENLAADFSHFHGSVECRDCGCLLPLPTKSPATQAASWNRRAAPASPLGDGWRPIEAAPRQERVLLGHKDFKGWFCLAICNALGEWSYDDRPWGQQDKPDKEATHWMPLPAAPIGAK